MALVTLDTPETKIAPQAPEATHQGRFFNPSAHDQADLYPLELFKTDLLDLAGLVDIKATNPFFKMAFDEQAQDYVGYIRSGLGIGFLQITFPRHFTQRSDAYNGIIADYQVGVHDEERVAVAFGGGALTAAKVLAFPGSTGRNNPILDARIRSSGDTPIQVFDLEQGGVIEQPSPGRWYRFPLQDTEIHLLKIR